MNRLFILLIAIGLLNCSYVTAAANSYTQDTVVTTTNATAANSYDDDYAPGLLLMALMVLCGMIFVFSFPLVLAGVSILIIFFFISAGIISASVFTGLRQRSFSKGIKMFVILSSAIGGLFLGAFSFIVINDIFDLHYKIAYVIEIGGASGLLGGLLLGMALNKISTMAIGYLQRKLGK